MDPITLGFGAAVLVGSAWLLRRARRSTRLIGQLRPVLEAYRLGEPDCGERFDVLRAALKTDRDRLLAAQRLFDIRAYRPALHLVEDAIADPDRRDSSDAIRHRLARVRVQTLARLDDPSANDALAAWASSHPDDAMLVLERAEYQLARRDLTSLLDWLPAWVEQHAELSVAHSILGRAWFFEGELDKARVQLEHACQLREHAERHRMKTPEGEGIDVVGPDGWRRHEDDKLYLEQIADGATIASGAPARLIDDD